MQEIRLMPINVYGTTQYVDTTAEITASSIDGRWVPEIKSKMFDAGFTNIACMSEFLSHLDEYEEQLSMLGYRRNGDKFVRQIDENSTSAISIINDGQFEIETFLYDDTHIDDPWTEDRMVSSDFEMICNHILQLFEHNGIDIFSSIVITSAKDSDQVFNIITAAMTTKDLAKNLVRVKSSNIWSYGINIKDRKDRTGNVLVQFKDSHGGAGDIYEYFDVPKTVWRKWLSATSKGHFLWKFIRNNYAYRKLTGDKKGKLPNAVN